jgi:hypothetical protein
MGLLYRQGKISRAELEDWNKGVKVSELPETAEKARRARRAKNIRRVARGTKKHK